MGRLLLIFILMTSAACTRSVEDLNVNLTLPVSSKNTGLSGERLETLIVNLHNVPGRPSPWFFEFNFEETSFNGVVEIPDVPKASGIIVQVLGVYEDTITGGTRVAYDGETVDLTQKSDVTVTLVTQNTPGRMAEIAGRYLNSSAPHPTGTLVGYYKPPGNEPRMKVWQSQIVAGWFTAIALEQSTVAGRNVGIDFVVERPGGLPEKIFNELHFKDMSGALKLMQRDPMGIVGEIAMEPSKVLISKAKSFRSEDNGQMEVDGERLMYMGFFGPGVVSEKICYPNDVSEGLLRVKRETSPGSGVYIPMDVDLTGITNPDPRVIHLAGGLPESFADHYSYTGACVPSDAGHLIIHHQYLGDRTEDALGMNVPFKSLGILGTFPQYIKGDFGQTSASKATLKWQTLPGVHLAAEAGPGAIQGYDLLYRPHSNSSSGDIKGKSEIDQCEDLIAGGFEVFASVTDGNLKQHSFTHLGSTALNASNWRNYDYAVCAYTATNAGKIYIGNYIRSSCLGNQCEDLFHTGWASAINTDSHTVGADPETFTGAGGHVARVTLVETVTAPSDHLLIITTDTTGFTPGDEVLLVVQSEGQANSCGDYAGENLSVGLHHSTRVVDKDASTIKVPKGSWVSGLVGNNKLGVPPAGGTDHCFIQAVKVLHLRNLDIPANMSLVADPFQFDSNAGGVVAVRVNGVLTMHDGSSIDVSGKGYEGGDNSSSVYGASRWGNRVASSGGDMAQGSISTPGGGGAGVVGNGGISTSGLNGGSGLGFFGGATSFQFGGGGGGGVASAGAAGGGSAFVVANKYVGSTTTAPSILADGLGSGATLGGGGGGGSVNLFIRSSQGPLNLGAAGGGGYTSGADSSGAGGGGFISAVICDLGGGTLDGDVLWDTGSGTSGWTVNASGGSSRSIKTVSDGHWEHFCKH